MQRSLEYYFKGESSGVAAVSGSSSGLQKREKEKVMINVLFTKRRSIIAPKSRDNYPYILNVRAFTIFNYYFLALFRNFTVYTNLNVVYSYSYS